MTAIINQNAVLTATGTCYEGKVNDIGALSFFVDDNGGGSTITFETAPDGSSYTAFSAGVYTIASGTGVVAALGASTTTAKGRYLIDLTGVKYFRARVSTFVSGTVVTRFEESNISLQRVLSMLQTGLIAQGTTQATAWPLQAIYNAFATVGASSGAILSFGIPVNGEQVIKNGGASALTVYPPVGGKINGGSVNAGVSLAAAASARFISDGTGNFWSF